MLTLEKRKKLELLQNEFTCCLLVSSDLERICPDFVLVLDLIQVISNPPYFKERRYDTHIGSRTAYAYCHGEVLRCLKETYDPRLPDEFMR